MVILKRKLLKLWKKSLTKKRENREFSWQVKKKKKDTTSSNQDT